MTAQLFFKLGVGFFVDLIVGVISRARLVFAVATGVIEVLVLEEIAPKLRILETQTVGALMDDLAHLAAAL
jgi:hypothetical protein